MAGWIVKYNCAAVHPTRPEFLASYEVKSWLAGVFGHIVWVTLPDIVWRKDMAALVESLGGTENAILYDEREVEWYHTVICDAFFDHFDALYPSVYRCWTIYMAASEQGWSACYNGTQIDAMRTRYITDHSYRSDVNHTLLSQRIAARDQMTLHIGEEVARFQQAIEKETIITRRYTENVTSVGLTRPDQTDDSTSPVLQSTTAVANMLSILQCQGELHETITADLQHATTCVLRRGRMVAKLTGE